MDFFTFFNEQRFDCCDDDINKNKEITEDNTCLNHICIVISDFKIHWFSVSVSFVLLVQTRFHDCVV